MLTTEEIANRITSWIREKVLAAGCHGVVLGMSGGVDSSVVAVLCQRAFPNSTLGVIMPCHNDPGDTEYALAVARKSGITTRTIVLDKICDALRRVLPANQSDPDTQKRAEANLKPRLRMTVLYYLANQLGYLVVGCGNKSEISVGYFTKYGDGGVDIQPLGNLVKKQVIELAIYLGIPQEIIDKPPSAGLWQGQTDESEMGLTYEILDHYLLTGEAAAEIKQKIWVMMAASNHKRSLPPVGVLD